MTGSLKWKISFINGILNHLVDVERLSCNVALLLQFWTKDYFA